LEAYAGHPEEAITVLIKGSLWDEALAMVSGPTYRRGQCEATAMVCDQTHISMARVRPPLKGTTPG